MGGAAGVNLLLGMFRVKFAAVLIGTAGVGLLASFTAVQGFFGTMAGLGIQSSAVRDVAAAVSRGDNEAIGRAVVTLRRICWITGLAGLLVMVAFSSIISLATFGSDKYALDVAAIGVAILFGNLSGGQMALLQGVRPIGDLARANVVAAAFATFLTIGLYAALGVRGIVPAIVCIAATQLAVSWYFARRSPIPVVSISWRQTLHEADGMVRLGLVFMWNGLLVSAVTYFTVTLISQQIGLEAVGLYSAAFALSGILVNFVLNAMGADYFPRLTGVAHGKGGVNRLVNEQTEIGLLLALPGLIGTLALAPWLIRIFYTGEFLPAVELLQWFILGCLGRVISWPLGFVMLALGKGRWFFLTETAGNVTHILLIAAGLAVWGLPGVATAFFVLYIGYTIAVLAVARHLTGFKWSPNCVRLGAFALAFLAIVFIASKQLSLWPATVAGALAATAVGLYSLRGLVQRIGAEHRLTKAALSVPIIKNICGY